MKTLEFRIRKLHVNSETERKLQKRQPSRIYVGEEALIELTGGKDGGKVVFIEKAADANHDGSFPHSMPRREATLWKAPEKLDKGVTQMYDAFRDASGYRLGEHVRITALGGTLPDAVDIAAAQENTAAAGGAGQEPLRPAEIPGWEFFLCGRLSYVEHVYAGLTFRNLTLRGPERSFVVASVNGQPAGNARYLDWKTTVTIAKRAVAGEQVDAAAGQKLQLTGIRGLDAQVEKLNNLLRVFTIHSPARPRGIPPAIVVHGGHGTGKTLLLNNIAKSGWGTVFRIQFKDRLAEIQDAFQKARLHQPSIVLIDQLERLIDKDRNNRGAVVITLCEALDSLVEDAATRGEPPQVLVVMSCQDYTTDIPEDLKEPRRLTSEIYLPLPDVDGRREILTSMGLGVDSDKEEALLRQLSERTHAYNGKDLRRLVDEAQLLGAIRHSKTDIHSEAQTDDTDANANANADADADADAETPPAAAYYTAEDYEEALKLVRPSAMHDINLKPPPIHWSDIGGQDSVKTSLRRAVRLSTESAEVLSRYFKRAPKGFLLYGPPGCSKTMAAQAMATESGLNFFAVKGAELLNMYVGESERAVRRLFQRAREVAPSMIFFDEIDSIASQRHGFGQKPSSSSSSGGGINVLTTLLNEMDGFEALQGVIVLAATNRPQALDPALLRPGRFDELIYVSPPDEAARRAIFARVAAQRAMNPDVDVDALARDTDGYSGAEIQGICTVAGIAAYDRDVASRVASAGGDVMEENGGGIMMQDLESAIKTQKRQITREMVQGFEEWEKQFRRY
ncbi:P-loop containing nucleoside triphosphate hydrolase protein [Lasiosphaeria miniovina]|uniref:P-loop containing nucleoside triphosphate hydrolase protein n=1 Tax=Lasiosphaeria miniovina TaxID=1954250 RepID=A0AA40ALX7_9PEZI|nr:P-loop containing nucleoside triphosphate hydrolase protein [Lasiosphaeria miniovina]KAK0718283.1 P-loop containing nucleoside triphosphate hydrolase protein [Lasiosphaeria miniovina]